MSLKSFAIISYTLMFIYNQVFLSNRIISCLKQELQIAVTHIIEEYPHDFVCNYIIYIIYFNMILAINVLALKGKENMLMLYNDLIN